MIPSPGFLCRPLFMEFFERKHRVPDIEGVVPSPRYSKYKVHFQAFDMGDGTMHYETELVPLSTPTALNVGGIDKEEMEYFYQAMLESKGPERQRPALTAQEATDRLQRAREEAARDLSTTAFFGPTGDPLVKN